MKSLLSEIPFYYSEVGEKKKLYKNYDTWYYPCKSLTELGIKEEIYLNPIHYISLYIIIYHYISLYIK